MKHHKAVDILITKAEATQQCAYGTTKAHRSALARRVQARELKRVFPNMYAASEYWDSLQPDERIRHIARTLHNRHPDWVFAGVTAAAIHDFEHQWHLHAGTITLATTSRGPNASSAKVKRIFTSSSICQWTPGDQQSQNGGGLRAVRRLPICTAHYRFGAAQRRRHHGHSECVQHYAT